ncbi:MAG: hypothetical protein HYV26_20910 [Candidatus Hydrogenedentes bacterium]|nr:hypothetical protein [Candidatus Hydrogenedentota bacterium]
MNKRIYAYVLTFASMLIIPTMSRSAYAVEEADPQQDLIPAWDAAFAARDRAELFHLLGQVYTISAGDVTLLPISKEFESRLLTFYLFEYQRSLFLSAEGLRKSAESHSIHVSRDHNLKVADRTSRLLDHSIALHGNLLLMIGEDLPGEEAEMDEQRVLATLAESTLSPIIYDAVWTSPARGPNWKQYLAEAAPERTLDNILQMQLGPQGHRIGNPHLLYSPDGLQSLTIDEAFEILALLSSKQPELARRRTDTLTHFIEQYCLYNAPDGPYAQQEKYVPLFDYRLRQGAIEVLSSIATEATLPLLERLLKDPPPPPPPMRHQKAQPPLKEVAQR